MKIDSPFQAGNKQEVEELVSMLAAIRDMAMGFQMFLPANAKQLLANVNAKLKVYGK
jgi:hypothetical protein